MKKTIIALSLMACANIHAQVAIDGRHACLDTQTNTMLATIPERLFGNDATLQVKAEQGWVVNAIDNVPVVPDDLQSPLGTGNDVFTFKNISAESKWVVRTTSPEGETRNDTLQFTFLPLVQLKGDFGYEYADGTFIFSHPDSAGTDTLPASIKWRGGTTNAEGKHKRNYKVKFGEDHRFLGLRNDNNWILDAGQPDVFRMRNRIAMDLWNDMARKPYYADKEPKARNGVRGEMTELFLGNEYRGMYNFSENMDRKQLKLKKLDPATGEIHGCLYKALTWHGTRLHNYFEDYDNTKGTFWGFEMKYPDLGDSDTVDWAPLVNANNFLHDTDNETFTQQLGDYFDIPVLIDHNIFISVVNAVDNGGKNTYWAIYDKADYKCLTLTPWDLDASMGQRWGGSLLEETPDGIPASPEFQSDIELKVYYRLYRGDGFDYNGALNERYRYLRQEGQVLHTDSVVSRITKYYLAAKNSGAAKRETEKWSGDSDVWGDTIDFDAEYEYICNFMRQRLDFIDRTEFPLYYKKAYFDELGVLNPTVSFNEGHDTYDLSGRKVTNGTMTSLKPGLYIRDGRKIIVR